MNIAPGLHMPISSSSGNTMLFLPLRRSHPRYPVQNIVSYQYEGKRILTLTLDLGLGGMKIKSHQSLCEDEHLYFKLILGRVSIWMKGRVVYSQFLPDKQNTSGVEFLELSSEDFASLQDYLGTLVLSPGPRTMLSAGERKGAEPGSCKAVEES